MNTIFNSFNKNNTSPSAYPYKLKFICIELQVQPNHTDKATTIDLEL